VVISGEIRGAPWLDQFKDTKTGVILEPSEYRTGEVIAPDTSFNQ
jgi:hypothetical protein